LKSIGNKIGLGLNLRYREKIDFSSFMSQFPHDKFAKNLFELLLTPFGSVNLQRVIQSETKFVDIYFEPNPNPPDSANLGLLAQCLNQHPAIFEPFRNPVTVDDIQMCLVKVFEVQQELNREHKRLKQPFSARVSPRLWILTPTLAAHTLGKFGAANEVEIWGKGVYLLPEHLQMGIIVVHQLPQIPQTRWFRLMGKGKVQQTAVAELAALPLSDPYRGDALDLFLSLRLELEAKQTIDIEEQELIMQLSPLYLEKIQAAKREGEIIGEARGEARGEAKGEAKGEARMVVRLLNRRLGSVPEQFSAQIQQLTVSQLEDLGEALLDFTSLIDLENWLS